MRREKRNEREDEKIKWGKLISFLIAIILLGVAIAISMTQERTVGELNYNNIRGNNTLNTTPMAEEASSELSKNVNEVISSNNTITNNTTGGDNEEENDDEINEIKNSLEVNTNNIDNNTTKQNVNEEDKNDKKEENKDNNIQEDAKVETKFIFPVEGEVVKEFAKDSLVYSETLEEWITHMGIDIKADRSSVVKAVADGTVKSIKNDPRYGLTVTIEHNDGYTSSYSSLLTAEFVKEGEKVTQGQTIGSVGNSAVFEVSEDNHLHFELLKDGANINPEMYLK